MPSSEIQLLVKRLEPKDFSILSKEEKQTQLNHYMAQENYSAVLESELTGLQAELFSYLLEEEIDLVQELFCQEQYIAFLKFVKERVIRITEEKAEDGQSKDFT